MGDRLTTIGMGRKWGGAAVGAGSLSNTMYVAWAEAYHFTKWHLDPSNRISAILQRK